MDAQSGKTWSGSAVNDKAKESRILPFSKLPKALKLIFGVLTAWPFLYMILFFAAILILIFISVTSQGSAGESAGKAHEAGGPMPVFVLVLVCLHVFTMLLIFALCALCILDVFKNDRVAKDKKTLWAVVLFMGGIFSCPVYWYIYIWKEPEASIERSPPASSVQGGNT
jgi:hypothetical protein